MLIIQINICMTLVLSSIAVHAYFKLDRKEQIHRDFFRLVVIMIIILMLEILSVVMNSHYFMQLITAHKLVDILGFALAPLVPISAVLYVYKKVDKCKNKIPYKYFWLSLPLVINCILALGSYKFNWIFQITNENLYVRGPLFFVAPMICLFYYMINVVILYKNRNKITTEERVVLSLLAVIPMVMSVFQLRYFIYLTIWNSMAVAIIINYIYIVHSQLKIDPLTGLGNRVLYNEYLASLHSKSNIVLSVISFDLDDFKSINDSCGHHEGDHALRLLPDNWQMYLKVKELRFVWVAMNLLS